MKTDRFSDIIRRKLESIRPEFTENDWTRMQATLHQASPPQPGSAGTGQPFGGSVWSAHPWLMAAASVGTAALVTFAIWQQSEINQLRETIGQLKQKPAPATQVAPTSSDVQSPTLSQTDAATQSVSSQPDKSMSDLGLKESFSGKRDTVYITRYVTEPARLRLDAPDKRTERGTAVPPEQRYAETSRDPVSTGSLRQRNDLNTNQKTDSYGVSSTPLTSDKNTSDLSSPTLAGTTNAPLRGQTNTSYPSTTSDKLVTNQRTQNATERSGTKGKRYKRDQIYGTNSSDDQRNSYEPVNKSARVDKEATPIEPSKSEQVAVASGTTASYELATSRPLLTKSANWNALLAQRSKRIRQKWTPAVVEQPESSAPASQPVPRLGTQFRLGVGGELAGSSQNVGVFSEVLLGKHWSLGVGFVRAIYTNKFTNDEDFEDRTHRDFKKAFGPGIDQFRDITGIDTRQTRYQIPISVGYRVPLNQSLTLLSSIGTYLNLNNSENVTFFCRLPLPPFQQIQRVYYGQVDLNKQQPIGLINSLSLGTGLEWHSRHWALQGSPVINLPLQSATTMQPDQNWQQKTTVSLRARLLYQF